MNAVQIDEEEKTQKAEMLIDHSGLVKAPELKIDIAGKLGNRLLESIETFRMRSSSTFHSDKWDFQS